MTQVRHSLPGRRHTHTDAYRQGFEAGQRAASGEPLDWDQVKAMSPKEYLARKAEVDSFIKKEARQ